MVTQYVITCKCGRKWNVEARQAGEQIACSCGGQVDVPTMRGLAALPQVQQREAPAKGWSKTQGVFFVAGVLWVAAGVGTTWWCYWQARQPGQKFRIDDEAEDLSARVENLSLTESMKYWRMFREQPGRMLAGPQQPKEWEPGSPRYTRLAVAAAAATVLGSVGLVIGLFVAGRKARSGPLKNESRLH